MTKLIGKLNEQGYTNFRTSLHRIRLISVVAAVAALLSLYPLHEYFAQASIGRSSLRPWQGPVQRSPGSAWAGAARREPGALRPGIDTPYANAPSCPP
jgi:hypothetical protein